MTARTTAPDDENERIAERIAELMAQHGMARYVDGDALAAHLRPAREPGGTEEPVRE